MYMCLCMNQFVAPVTVCRCTLYTFVAPATICSSTRLSKLYTIVVTLEYRTCTRLSLYFIVEPVPDCRCKYNRLLMYPNDYLYARLSLYPTAAIPCTQLSLYQKGKYYVPVCHCKYLILTVLVDPVCAKHGGTCIYRRR